MVFIEWGARGSEFESRRPDHLLFHIKGLAPQGADPLDFLAALLDPLPAVDGPLTAYGLRRPQGRRTRTPARHTIWGQQSNHCQTGQALCFRKQDADMTNDPRCCGSGTCIVDPAGRCWCGQQWDGQKMCAAPLADRPTANESAGEDTAKPDDT